MRVPTGILDIEYIVLVHENFFTQLPITEIQIKNHVIASYTIQKLGFLKVMVYICNHSIKGTEAGELLVWGEWGIHKNTLSKKDREWRIQIQEREKKKMRKGRKKIKEY